MDDTPHELQHEKFGDAPGIIWGAKKQCEVRTLVIKIVSVDEFLEPVTLYFQS